jgi:hypothetical protein
LPYFLQILDGLLVIFQVLVCLAISDSVLDAVSNISDVINYELVVLMAHETRISVANYIYHKLWITVDNSLQETTGLSVRLPTALYRLAKKLDKAENSSILTDMYNVVPSSSLTKCTRTEAFSITTMR